MKPKALPLILILATVITAFADDSVYKIDPRGGTIYPINNKYIQMLEETVIFDQSTGELTTTFIFYNTSDKPQTVTFGFPVFPVDTGDESRYDPSAKIDKKKEIEEIERKLQFKTWVDGKEVRRELWKTDTSDRFKYAFIMTLEFKPKEKKTIVNKFKQGYGYGQSVGGYKWMSINYILSTGARWKGVIKEATIIFKLNKEKDLSYYASDTICTEDYACYEVYNGWTFEPKPTEINYDTKEVIWKFHNLEPTFDIVLTKEYNSKEIILGFSPIKDNLDKLSRYIITKDTANFYRLYNKLSGEKYMFEGAKEYYQLAYETYAKNLLKEANTDDPNLKAKIRHVINAFAALNGYEFSNPMWYKTFKLFAWYKPYTKNPNYPEDEKKLINDLLLLEKKAPTPTKAPTPQADEEKANIEKAKTNQNSQSSNLVLYIGLAAIILIALVVLFISRKKKTSK